MTKSSTLVYTHKLSQFFVPGNVLDRYLQQSKPMSRWLQPGANRLTKHKQESPYRTSVEYKYSLAYLYKLTLATGKLRLQHFLVGIENCYILTNKLQVS